MALDESRATVQGRVAIGERRTSANGKTFPAKTDYFVFSHPYDQKLGSAKKFPEMTEIMKKKYGTDKPKEIEIILMNDHPDEVFFSNYLKYKGSICDCHGNGQTAMRIVNDAGDKKEVECNYENCKYRLVQTNNGLMNTCKPTGILTYIMPEAPVSGGVWKTVTHSLESIGRIMGALKKIYALRGTLTGLKVNLKVVIVPMKPKGMATQNVPILELSLPFSWDELATGAGTTIGEFISMKNRPTLSQKPDPKVMQELATACEKEATPVKTEVVKETVTKAEFIDVEVMNSNEFEF